MNHRVIFMPDDYWTTPREDTVTDQPAAINRPLTDEERDLIRQVAIWLVAEQHGITDEQAADYLEYLTECRGLYMQGDDRNVWVKTGTPDDPTSYTLVHFTREWLAFFASHSDEPIDLRKYVKEIPQ